MTSNDLLTIDDAAEWWCEPHATAEDKVQVYCGIGDMLITMGMRKDIEPHIFVAMLGKLSAATWMLCESGGVLGVRKGVYR